jgi:hypothetical protein
MSKYTEGRIEEFEQSTEGQVLKIVSTPATDNLYRIRQEKDTTLLSKEKSNHFHSNLAKLLFLAKRGRPDILLAILFLTTRVKAPDEDDWKKLLRVLGYLKGTLDFELTISCNSLDKLTWYIDGSYAIHEDMKGHSGAVLMIGDSTVLSRSNKQKVNIRSSTEAELIAVDDTLPTVQRAKSFMMDQGYDLETVIKEDNKSTMLLMKNGLLSAGKRTKHLDIRYFYVKDLLERGIISIEHCATEDMVADFFTKPLQGKRFQILRDIILNRTSEASPSQYRSVLGNSTENIVSGETRERSQTGTHRVI